MLGSFGIFAICVGRQFRSAAILAVGLTCKAFLSLGFCSSVKVNGLHNLFRALESQDRDKGRGLITGMIPDGHSPSHTDGHEKKIRMPDVYYG